MDFEARLGGVAHTLRDRALVVPAFQRDYSWGEEQVHDFWLDLKASIATGRSYFIGTIVLSSQTRSTWNLIDGQQRLATTSLLLAAISHELAARGDSESSAAVQREYLSRWSIEAQSHVPRLLMNARDRVDFEAVLAGSEASSVADSSRLSAAYQILRSSVQAEAQSAGPRWSKVLAGWVDFLERDVQAIVMETRDDADAFMVFETLNDRGLALTVADLIKNKLLSQARSSLEQAVEMWNDATQIIESSVGPFDFTTFVRSWWSSTHGAVRERVLYPAVAANVANESDALGVLSQLLNAAPYYAALFDSTHAIWDRFGPRARSAARILADLGAEQARPLALSILRAEPYEADAMLELVVKAVIRSLVLGRAGGGTAERVYAEAAVRVSNGRVVTASALRVELEILFGSPGEFREALVSRRIFRTAIQKYMARAVAAEDAVMLGNDESVVQLVLPAHQVLVASEGESDTGGLRGRIANWIVVRPASMHSVPSDVLTRPRFLSEHSVGDDPGLMAFDGLPGLARAIEQRQVDLALRAERVWGV